MRILVVGDTHISKNCPGDDRFAALGKLERRLNADATIFIGDVLTCESVNEHIKPGTAEHKVIPTYLEEIRLLDISLNALRKGANKRKCFRHITKGNHEDWIAKQESKTPQLEGLLVSQLDNTFKDNLFSYSKYGALFELSNIYFTHVPIYQGRRLTCPMKIGARFDKSIVWGHSHIFNVSCFAKANNAGIKVINTGCYLPEGYVENYTMHDTLDSWTRGVFVLDTNAKGIKSINWLDISEVN